MPSQTSNVARATTSPHIWVPPGVGGGGGTKDLAGSIGDVYQAFRDGADARYLSVESLGQRSRRPSSSWGCVWEGGSWPSTAASAPYAAQIPCAKQNGLGDNGLAVEQGNHALLVSLTGYFICCCVESNKATMTLSPMYLEGAFSPCQVGANIKTNQGHGYEGETRFLLFSGKDFVYPW